MEEASENEAPDIEEVPPEVEEIKPWTLQIRPDGSIAVVIREEGAEEAHVVRPKQVLRALRKLVALAREA